jgi:hypothetical protein
VVVRWSKVEKQTYIGGARFAGVALGRSRASWPLARLTLNDDGIRVGLRAPFRFLHRDVRIPWGEVERIERYGFTGQRGIRFLTGKRLDRRDGVVFWCTPKDFPEVVASIERQGISIDK